MDRSFNPAQDNNHVTAILADSPSKSADASQLDCITPASNQPELAEMITLAQKYVDRIVPSPSRVDLPFCHQAWTAWLAAKFARTPFGRFSAIEESLMALALLKDRFLAKSVLQEQLAASSPDLRNEYESLVSEYPLLGELLLEGTATDEGGTPGPNGTTKLDSDAHPSSKDASSRRASHLSIRFKLIVAVFAGGILLLSLLMPRSNRVPEVKPSPSISDKPNPVIADTGENPEPALLEPALPSKAEDPKEELFDESDSPANLPPLCQVLEWFPSESMPALPGTDPDALVKTVSNARSPRPKINQVAEAKFLDALEKTETKYGVNTLATAPELDTLIDLYFKEERFERAEPYLERRLRLFVAERGMQNPESCNCAERLARCYYEQGKFNIARDLYLHLLGLYQEDETLCQTDLATALENVAKSDLALQNFDDAATRYRESLNFREAELGKNHPDVANSLDSLGMSRLCQGHIRAAESEFKRAFEIRQKEFGDDHPLTMASLSSLGMLSCAKKDYATAEDFYRKVLTFAEKNFGSSDVFTASCMENLAKVQAVQRNFTDAKPLFLQVWKIRIDELGIRDKKTIQARENYQRVLKFLPDDDTPPGI